MKLVFSTQRAYNNYKIVVIAFFVFITLNSPGNNNYLTALDSTHTETEKQSKRISLLIGANFIHYFPTSEAKNLNWVTAPFNLGSEILVGYSPTKDWKVHTGINYQYGKIASNHDYYGDRTKFHEISFPILVDFPSFNLFKSEFILITGFYVGSYINIKRETKGGKFSSNSNDWSNFPIHYKDDRFILDYYLGIQNRELNALSPLFFTFFFKHQLNTNYLNNDISKSKCGLQIKFKL